MYEKVNPQHPDKIADRIAGALVDLAYRQGDFPHVAVEVLIGHGKCHIINETDTPLEDVDVLTAVKRITKSETIDVDYVEVQQDALLNANQHERVRCGDNGIFKGVHTTEEQRELTRVAGAIYEAVGTDGKYILDDRTLIICQSNMTKELYKELRRWLKGYDMKINPIGEWTGGTDVDTGATNRKLGSDMGDAVTGGGLHGKDLSKADVSVNIYLHQLAQRRDRKIALTWCAIGDDVIITEGDQLHHEETRFSDVIEIAREYVKSIGGFEKLAEWGLIRP